MRAAVYTSYGGPEQISVRQVQAPIPKNNEVLIRIHATTVSHFKPGNLCRIHLSTQRRGTGKKWYHCYTHKKRFSK